MLNATTRCDCSRDSYKFDSRRSQVPSCAQGKRNAGSGQILRLTWMLQLSVFFSWQNPSEVSCFLSTKDAKKSHTATKKQLNVREQWPWTPTSGRGQGVDGRKDDGTDRGKAPTIILIITRTFSTPFYRKWCRFWLQGQHWAEANPRGFNSTPSCSPIKVYTWYITNCIDLWFETTECFFSMAKLIRNTCFLALKTY